jgi:hypothetical protein
MITTNTRLRAVNADTFADTHVDFETSGGSVKITIADRTAIVSILQLIDFLQSRYDRPYVGQCPLCSGQLLQVEDALTCTKCEKFKIDIRTFERIWAGYDFRGVEAEQILKDLETANLIGVHHDG